jgi:hypothetical protein
MSDAAAKDAPQQPSLLETLRLDGEQLVESELPTINAVRPLLAALIARLEGHLPRLAEQSLAELTGIKPDPAATAVAEQERPAADAEQERPATVAGEQPKIGEFAAAQAAADAPGDAGKGAADDPAARAASAGVETSIVADEPDADAESDLDRELREAENRVTALQAQRAAQADAAAAQRPQVSS